MPVHANENVGGVRAPLRLLYLLEDTDPGGPAEEIVRIVARLMRMQSTIAVCSLAPHGQRTEKIQAKNVGVVSLEAPEARGPRGLGRDFLAIMRLKTLCDRFRPDVIHAVGARASMVARYGAALAGGVGVLASETSARGFRRLLSGWSRVIHPSSVVLVDDPPESRSDRDEVSIGLGVDLAAARSAMPVDEAVLPEGVRYVGMPVVAGRTEATRRLLEAFGIFGAGRPDVHLCILGTREEARVEPWLDDLGLADRTHFVPLPDPRASLLQRMHVVWAHGEERPDSRIIVDAMAIGVPVVCDPSTVLARRIETIGGALMRDGHWPRQFAEATRDLFDDDELHANVGRGGRELVDRHHAYGPWCERLRDLYGRFVDPEKAAEVRPSEGLNWNVSTEGSSTAPGAPAS